MITVALMEELAVKKDFSDIYTQKNPQPYLLEMKNLDYRIPDQTKPLYKHLAERIVNYKKSHVKILDLGSSYGINSALLGHELIMSELDNFFENHPESSIKETQRFFDDLPNNDPNLEFYLNDTSSEALEFATNAGLCEDSFCVNLEKDPIPTGFKKALRDIDLVVSTGCVGYIGRKAFAKIFEGIDPEKTPLPLFAFTVLRIFRMDDMERVFRENDFELIKTKIGPLKQRRFHSQTEEEDTIELLSKRNIDTTNLEDEGSYFADFYVAGPKCLKSSWMLWVKNLEDVFVPIAGA